MASYIFNIIINKPGAFSEYIQKNFSFYDYSNSGNGTVEVFSTKILTPEELNILTLSVNAYVDPAEYLTLASQFADSSSTTPSNSTTISTVKTFIHCASFASDGVFNTFKMIVKYTCESLDAFTIDSSCILTLQLFCETRGYLMKSIEFDVSPIINEWKSSGTPDSFVKYKSLMLPDLRSNVTNYDTICSFKAKISSSNVYFSFHSLQSLYYNII